MTNIVDSIRSAEHQDAVGYNENQLAIADESVTHLAFEGENYDQATIPVYVQVSE